MFGLVSIKALQSVIEQAQKDIKYWQDYANHHKDLFNRSQSEVNRLWNNMPIVEFVCGDRETGYVWIKNIDQLEEVAVGNVFALETIDMPEVPFRVVSIDGFKNKRLSVTVVVDDASSLT